MSDQKYSDLTLQKGTFSETMSLSSQAKSRFEHADLVRRGEKVLKESADAGVSAMRAFIEVDETVGLKSLKAGLELKSKWKGICDLQICAFAQLPIYDTESSHRNQWLLELALTEPEVDVLGSTPYVEDDIHKAHANIKWIIDMALLYGMHIDFHLDYNLDES